MLPNNTHSLPIKRHPAKAIRLGFYLSLLWLMGLSYPFTQTAEAFDPHLRLPWAPGPPGRNISGSQYGGGLHTEADFYAIDFGLPFNTAVHAAQGGYVTTYSDPNCRHPCYNTYITIDHGNGYITLYAHLSAFEPNINGTNVTQGQRIGSSGHSGLDPDPNTGLFPDHLHFAARFNGVAYMPEPMSGYTGFGNRVNFNSTLYINNPQPSDVMRNGSFETVPAMNDDYRGGVGPWQHSPGSFYAFYGGGAPGQGNTYLEINAGYTGAGAWLVQNFPAYDSDWSNYTQTRTLINMANTNPSVPDSWTVRAWMRAPQPWCGRPSSTLAIWALNGPPQEAGSTSGFVLDDTWRVYTAKAKFNNNGHNRLQVIFYLDDPNCNYDIDGVTLERSYINNTSFEESTSYWSLFHYPQCRGDWLPFPNDYLPPLGPPKENTYYLEANLGNCPTGTVVSPLQDVYAYTQPGEVYTATAWIRAFPPYAGADCLAGLYLMTLPRRYDNSQWLNLNTDTNWHEFTTSLTLPSGAAGNNDLHIEMYMWNQGCQYDFDGTKLTGGMVN